VKYALFLGGALALAASAAHAEYVCEVNLSPPAFNPSHGRFGEIVMSTSPQQNCSSSVKQSLICSEGSTDDACGVHSQFSELALNTLYTAIHEAQMRQQPVWIQSDVCNGLGNSWSCRAGVVFRGP